jgi:hypothetical protein
MGRALFPVRGVRAGVFIPLEVVLVFYLGGSRGENVVRKNHRRPTFSAKKKADIV